MGLTTNGQVRYQLKTPYRNGTTPVIFESQDLIAKLAALTLVEVKALLDAEAARNSGIS